MRRVVWWSALVFSYPTGPNCSSRSPCSRASLLSTLDARGFPFQACGLASHKPLHLTSNSRSPIIGHIRAGCTSHGHPGCEQHLKPTAPPHWFSGTVQEPTFWSAGKTLWSECGMQRGRGRQSCTKLRDERREVAGTPSLDTPKRQQSLWPWRGPTTGAMHDLVFSAISCRW